MTAARPLKVAVIGSGFEARGLLEAVSVSLQVAAVRVYSPTPASRERFAQSFRDEQGLDIVAAASPAAAVEGADLVLCAARSRDESPVLRGEWLEPGMTVVSLGSTLPEQREVDELVLARAARIIADMPDEVLHETGDAIAATNAEIDVAGKLSTDVARNVDDIARMGEQNTRVVVEAASAAARLERLAEGLESSVARFRV